MAANREINVQDLVVEYLRLGVEHDEKCAQRSDPEPLRMRDGSTTETGGLSW